MDKEIWKDIEGYEGLYQVSNLGRVRNIRVLKPAPTKDGYLRVCFSVCGKTKGFLVHRLVAKAFIPNTQNSEVNHIDGNKMNNSVGNLEWSTRSDNILHAYRNGLIKSVKGDAHWLAKLTKEQVEQIRKEYIPYDKKYGRAPLARKYGVDPHTIWLILANKSYEI